MSNILFAVEPASSEHAGITTNGNGPPAHIRAGTIEECHSAMRQLLGVIQALQQERDALRAAEGGADVCRLLELEKEVGLACVAQRHALFCFVQDFKK
jgi:hypothetical protein